MTSTLQRMFISEYQMRIFQKYHFATQHCSLHVDNCILFPTLHGSGDKTLQRYEKYCYNLRMFLIVMPLNVWVPISITWKSDGISESNLAIGIISGVLPSIAKSWPPPKSVIPLDQLPCLFIHRQQPKAGNFSDKILIWCNAYHGHSDAQMYIIRMYVFSKNWKWTFDDYSIILLQRHNLIKLLLPIKINFIDISATLVTEKRKVWGVQMFRRIGFLAVP